MSGISLAVVATGTPVPGHFYQDIGRYAMSGSVGADDATATVTIYQRPATGSTTWTKVATTTSDATGRFTTSLAVTSYGSFVFAATIGGSPTGATAAVSNLVKITVENASIAMKKPATSIDSLTDTTISGQVVPARAGVTVIVEVKNASTYVQTALAKTAADGRYSAKFTYGHGHLATYEMRARYVPANRPTRIESSERYSITRAAVIHAVVTSTTAADVAKTYHAGCPLGRSSLKTIALNYYGFDKLMHRGVIIVRHDLTTKVIRGFSSALAHRFPISKMNNPNVYGGDDPTQMAADNTSGFNCRKVVGNPYRMSPHSYGIALDVNTVQNPYRDSRGKWWPTNGKAYIKRTPYKKGMLRSISYLTKSLRKDKFFWGGFWSPGKDYQHFEYRG